MPSFNQARFLREALDSVLSQPWPDLEVIVMDGGSTDGSVEILRGYGERISFVSERDRGQADAINRGFAKATGEIVAWLNSDDRYAPSAIPTAVAALSSHPDAAMVYGEGDIIDAEGRVTSRFGFTQPFDLWALINVADYIMQPTAFMRTACLRAVGGLDESLHYGLDWDLWIRLGCRWRLAYVPALLAETREYGETKTSTGGFRRFGELRRIMSRHGARPFAPAAVGYGLDTLRRVWPVVFGPSTRAEAERLRAHPGARIFRRLHTRMARLIEWRMHHGQGVYADRSLARRSFLALPWDGRAGRVTVTLEVDAATLPQRFEVRAGGRHAVGNLAAAGQIPITLEVPAGRTGPAALEVEIRAARTARVNGRDVAGRLRDAVLEHL